MFCGPFDDDEQKALALYNKLVDRAIAERAVGFEQFFPTQNTPLSKSLIYWCTVNPKPEVDITAFVSQIHRVMNRSLVEQCVYTFEQRGENINELGKGVHMHAIIWPGKSYSTSFCKHFRDAVSNLVGCPNKHIWIVKAKGNWVNEKMNYLKGIKWDREKDKKCAFDKEWRSAIGIQPWYSKNMEMGGISTSDKDTPTDER